MDNDDLKTKQRLAIMALMSGATQKEAAAAANVHPNRITEWMKDPDFLAELRKSEGQALDEVSRSLVVIGLRAVSTLDHVLQKRTARDMVKIRAASVVLARLIQIRELSALEERVRAIEDALKDKK